MITTQVETNNPLQRTTLWENRKAAGYSIALSVSMFQFGLDYSIVGAAQAMKGFLEVFGYPDPSVSIGWNLDATVQQLFGSLLLVGGFTGSVLTGPLGTYVGRRYSIAVAAILTNIGLIIMLASTNVGAVYFSRIVMGTGNVMLSVFAQMYIAETMPAQYRGLLFGFISFWQSVGSLVGAIITNFTSTIDSKACYQIPFGICLVIPTCLCIVVPFFPETPRWLLLNRKDHEAENALRRIRPSDVDQAKFDKEFEAMREARDVELAEGHRAPFFDLFRGINLRRTILSVSCGIMQTGSTFLIGYTTYFFLIAGQSQPFIDSIIAGCAGIAGCLLSFFLVRICGRRNILGWGGVIQALCMMSIGVAYTVAPGGDASGKVLLVFVFIYLATVAASYTPYAFVVGTEIPSQRHRSMTIGLLTAVSYTTTWVASYTTPIYINPSQLNWGPKYCWIWFPSNLAMAFFVYFFIPETKDRTLEEIDEMFELKLGARKFKRYQCIGLARAVEAKVEEKSQAAVSVEFRE